MTAIPEPDTASNAPMNTRPDVLSAEPRWSAWLAMLTCWWLPAATAQRTQHVLLKRAWLVHLVSALLTIVVSMALIGWHEPASLSESLTGELGEYAYELERHPLEIGAATIGIIIGTEAGFFVLALLLGSWGAADEPVVASIRNALRQVWLHTADAIPAAVLILSSWFWLEEVSRTGWQELSALQSVVPDINLSYAPPGTPAGDEFRRQNEIRWQRLRQIERDWRSRRHWYRNHPQELGAAITLTSMVYVFGVMLRAIGARRAVVPVARHPMCEACGYNLLATPADSRCPECGQWVQESLGPDVRRGAPWEQRRELGWLRAWWRTVAEAMVRPSMLGRRLRVSSRVVDHRWFPGLHALVIFVLMQVSVVLLVFLVERGQPYASDLARIAWNEAAGAAAFCGGIVLALPPVGAGLIGIYLRWRWGRNLIPAAMQMACYLSGCLVLCIMASGVVLAGIIAYLQHLVRTGQGSAAYVQFAMTCLLCWLGFNILMLLLYLTLLYKGAVQGRYANR